MDNSHKDVYPDIKRVVKESHLDTELVKLPFDSGLAKCRNKMFDERFCRYDRLLMCDDDFLFTPDTKINCLHDTMDGSDAVVVGGGITSNGNLRHYEFLFDIEEEDDGIVLSYRFIREKNDPMAIPKSVFPCHMTFNFFLCDWNKIHQLDPPWNPKLKVAAEHTDFFLTLYFAKAMVMYDRRCTVEHTTSRPTMDYKKLRDGRAKKYMALFMKEEGIKEIKRGEDVWM